MDDRVWQKLRKRVIASRDPICALCGNPIDMEAPPYTPMSCEVDHIIPISRGGAAYDIDNLQLTHAKCNRQKSNRLREDYGDEDPNANLCPLSNNW
jgi:5-methylcytosine-specific restriction endonuclease McrA